VFVKMLTGKDITIEFELTDRIIDVKLRIQGREGTRVEQSRLPFAGKQLDDDKTAPDHGMTKDSTLHLVLRLLGGGKCKGELN